MSQSVLDMPMQGAEKGKRLIQYLQDLEQKKQVRFYFMDNWIDKITFKDNLESRTLRVGLDELFEGTDVAWIEINPRMVVFIKDPNQTLRRNNIVNTAVQEQKKVDRLVIGKNDNRSDSHQVTLAGKVIDAKTSLAMAAVSVYVSDLQTGITTNSNGNYELNLPAGPHIVTFSHINFDDQVVDLEIYENGKLDIVLEEIPTLLQEVVVVDPRHDFLTKNLGLTQLNIASIKKAPSMLGEADIIKQIQTLPGVTTVGEAASGFNVRGGSVDQNLILYDGLPVFNTSHVFGFFSSFNAEAVRDADFYKGGIPAEFGGRTSSVLSIRSKEGSYDKWHGNAGISSISCNFLLQGPIVKDKTSIVASIRTTYSDWMINTVRSNYINLDKSTASFYDGSAKLTHQFSGRTKLTLSSYLSHDEFLLRGDTTFQWDTQLNSLRLDHSFTKGVNTSFMIGYGKYSYDVSDKNPQTGFDLTYALRYPTAKLDFYIQREKHEINVGAQSIYYDFSPGTLTPSSSQSDKKLIQMDKQQSLESGFYASDQFDIFRSLHADAGLRYSLFQSMGPGNVFAYQPGKPKETLTVVDTLHFKDGENIKTYGNWEPRLSLRYDLSPFSNLKLGYNRMFQYLHVITNTTAITPVDIWQPSGYHFKPQMADQISIGYNHSFKSKAYDWSVEVYYKKMHNVLDFKDGAVLLLNSHLEADLLQGDGRAYGAETQIIKNTGRLTGSLSYAYARSFRTFQSIYPEETINGGKEYKSNYDQPHVVTTQWRYSISRKYFFSGTFTYHTGRPLTLPQSAFSVSNFTVSAFSDRNQFRVPDYHRLDLAIGMEGNHKRKKMFDVTWILSIYNVYGRKNPYSVFFQEVQPGILRPYRLAIIGTALPSLSVNIKF